MKLRDWLNKNFGITSSQKEEVQFPCPKCQHPAFYFNLTKKVGYCHRASCHWKPGMKEINKYARFYKAPISPTTDFLGEPDPGPIRSEISLPGSAQPLVYRDSGVLVSRYPDAVSEVAARGVTPENQYKFNLHISPQRIYIPVYSEGKIVNYVGRAFPWKRDDIKRYSYATGVSTRAYLFNWDNAKSYPSLVLVENTFNAIWLSDHCHASTNFGSDLSKEQINLITKSKVRTVVFLWDEGAEWAAGRARERLAAKGIQSTYLKIKGQPDDYAIEWLLPWIEYALSNASKQAIIDTCQTPSNKTP